MKYITFSLFALLFIVNSCSSEKSSSFDKVCSLKIDGMMCEKGCKSTIESKLAKMEGVQEAKVDFETNVALVTFNSSVTSSKAMIEMIGGIADGAYSATIIEETYIENAAPSNLNAHKNNEASVEDYSFEVPNVSDIFSNIF
jgi:copper chaperone CopZ